MWTFFSGIFGGIGSFFGGIFASIQQYFIVAMLVLLVTVSGGFYLYYSWSQSKIEQSEADQQKLEDALNTTNNAFVQLQKDTVALQKNYQDLQTKQNAIQKQNDALTKKIQQYNFRDSAIKNPDQTEKDINAETDNMLKDLEDISDPDNY
jgi:septal ring factor EnvC (AmiA/AmiB activator)